MSEIEQNTRELNKALDGYLEHSKDVADITFVGQILISKEVDLEKFTVKVVDHLQHYDFTKIKKMIDAIEYFTVLSVEKMRDVVNAGKFIEQIAKAAWEPDLQDQILQLARLWHDYYCGSKSKLPNLFDFIDSLEAFGIPPPAEYVSSFEGLADQTKGEPEQDKFPVFMQINPHKGSESGHLAGHHPPAAGGVHGHQMNQQSSDIDAASGYKKNMSLKEVIDKGQKLKKEASELIIKDLYVQQQDFDKLISDILITLSKIKYINGRFVEAQESGIWEAVKERCEGVMLALDDSEETLKHKLKEIETIIGKPVDTSLITGQQQQPNSNNNDEYRLLVNGENQKGNSHHQQDFGQMEDQFEDENQVKNPNLPLELEEYTLYKTRPCRQGMLCKYAPSKQKKQNATPKPGVHREFNCPRWHNMSDRRRTFCDENGRCLYKTTECRNKKGQCPYNEQCKFSHNYFESYFHPSKYKKNKCSDSHCRNKRYCPFYHTVHEKKKWQATLKDYFKDEDDDYDYDEVLNFKGNENDPFDVFNNDPPVIPHSDAARAAHDGHSNSPTHHYHGDEYGGSGVPRFGGKHHHHPPTHQQPEPEIEYKCNLKSNLKINKNYSDPQKLTSFFLQNKIHNGLPLVDQYKKPADQQNSSQKDKEESKDQQ